MAKQQVAPHEIDAFPQEDKAAGVDHRSQIVAGLVATSLALAGAGEAVASPDQARAKSGPTEASEKVREAKVAKACKLHRQVKLALIKKPTTKKGRTNFTLRAETCTTTKPALLEDVKLVETGPVKENHTWKVKTFPPSTKQFRKFSVPSKLPKKAKEKDKIIRLKALSKNDRVIGFKKYKLKYDVTGKIAKVQEVNDDGQARNNPASAEDGLEASCTPSPNFNMGAQHDDAIVFERYLKDYGVSREVALRKAQEVYGASAVRMNIIYGMAEAYTLQPYIDAVAASFRVGYNTVRLTIMPTTAYQPHLNQSLSYQNPNAALMQQFSSNIAQTVEPVKEALEDELGRDLEVTYASTNEPNHPTFSATQSMAEFESLYRATYAGIKTAYPNAKLIVGELDQRNLNDWSAFIGGGALSPRPDGMSVHPYGEAIHRLPGIVKASSMPVYATEYGNFSTDPQQNEKNQQAKRIAYCSGAEELTMYGVFQDPSKENTGVVPLP